MNFKKISLLICTLISSSIILTIGEAPAIEEKNKYANEIYGISLLFDALSQAAGTVLEEKGKKNLALISAILKDSYQVIAKSENVLYEINQFENRAQKLRKQFHCVKLKDPELIANESCSLAECANRRACLAALVNTSKGFLQPLIESMLGKVVTGKDNKRTIEPGILLVLANAKFIPEAKRTEIVGRLTDYTLKISTALDFLNLIAFILNPTISVPGLTDAQMQELKSEPIEIPAEEELSFED